MGYANIVALLATPHSSSQSPQTPQTTQSPQSPQSSHTWNHKLETSIGLNIVEAECSVCNYSVRHPFPHSELLLFIRAIQWSLSEQANKRPRISLLCGPVAVVIGVPDHGFLFTITSRSFAPRIHDDEHQFPVNWTVPCSSSSCQRKEGRTGEFKGAAGSKCGSSNTDGGSRTEACDSLRRDRRCVEIVAPLKRL